jgi:magnesium transporter
VQIKVAVCLPTGEARCGGEELLREAPPAGAWRWIDVEGSGPEVERLLLDFGFHPLAVEDTITLQHQPKVESYPDFLFAIVRGIDFNKKGTRLGTVKLAAFLGAGRLVTCHRAPMRSVAAVRQRIADSGLAPRGGPAHLLYLLYDQVIDYYQPVLDELAQAVEKLETQIFAAAAQHHLERLLELRRRLATLRRVMLPHRQVFHHLASGQSPLIGDQALFFRDINDNVYQLTDAIDQQRDQLGGAKDTYLSVVSQRTNDVMKVLTLFSATLLPLTFIAGVYGMNFEHMPELASRYGYFAVLAVMAGVAVALVAWFRHKGWL